MEKSSFFNSVNIDGTDGYDRVYYAEDFAEYFRSFIGNGVFLQNDINDLREEDLINLVKVLKYFNYNKELKVGEDVLEN